MIVVGVFQESPWIWIWLFSLVLKGDEHHGQEDEEEDEAERCNTNNQQVQCGLKKWCNNLGNKYSKKRLDGTNTNVNCNLKIM